MPTHIPVLLNECLEILGIKDGGTYVDFTLGRAGHASEILKRIPHGQLIGFDQDQEAVEASTLALGKIGSNFRIVKSNFSRCDEALSELGVEQVDGVLIDLGVSSPQLDQGERGFSYRFEAPLDMRMDRDNPLTAYEVVNGYSLPDLTRVIRDYGEEKEAYRIAKEIVRSREISPLKTTFDLVEAIKRAKPRADLSKKGHPAKQTFQAIRIEVNHEEEALMQALEKAPKLLSRGGRLAIISFMSLDDRLVKQAFHKLTTVEGDRLGLERPEEVRRPEYRLLTKKPILPSEEEVEANHRSASAKLRAIERI